MIGGGLGCLPAKHGKEAVSLSALCHTTPSSSHCARDNSFRYRRDNISVIKKGMAATQTTRYALGSPDLGPFSVIVLTTRKRALGTGFMHGLRWDF